MKVKYEEHDRALVVKFKGKLTIGEGDVRIREEFAKAVADGNQVLIFDMQGVSYLDSAAIGELVAIAGRMEEQGGAFGLTNLRAKVVHLLELITLSSVFRIFDSTEDALQILWDQVRKAA